MPSCPECNSSKTCKAGNRYVQGQKIQRYLCRDCGFRFTDPSFNKKVFKGSINEVQQTENCQICVTLTKEAKNLAAKQRKEVLQENGETKILIDYSMHLLKDGKAESTIETYTKLLKVLDKRCELFDPEAVKKVIATQYKDRNTKYLLVNAYESFIKFIGSTWNKPKYRKEHKQVFIPTEKELHLAMNTGNRKNVIFSHFLDETGARVNEAERLEWTDINKEDRYVNVKASKNGNPRIIDVSENLIQLLMSLPKNNDNYVFKQRPPTSRSSAFAKRMTRLSSKTTNPRFKKIHLHTFRHCKALREYHKTRDILHVMAILGHRNINTTYRYISLYNQIYKPQRNIKYVTKIASTKQERCDFINDGWELVDKDGEDWYFKKPE